MDLALTASQKRFEESVLSFVQREGSRPQLVQLQSSSTTWNPDWYKQFAQAGWLGMLIPEELGGAGADPLSVILLLKALGHGPVPSPLVASSVVSSQILLSLPQSDSRDALLRGIADGSVVVAPALRNMDGTWRGLLSEPLPLTGGPEGHQLNGTKLFVPFADSATHFLVSARDREGKANRFVVVPAHATGTETRLLSGFLHANHEVNFHEVRIADADVYELDAGTDYDDVLALARLAIAAYQIGGCEELLDMCVSYSSTRQQFGVPIGRFQRVQDHIVRLLNALDAARWIVYEAAWALQNGRNGVARSYMAAAVASESYVEAANAGHEVHAGIGSDPAFGLTLYTQASRTMYEYLGSPSWNRTRIADAMGWTSDSL